MKFCHECGTQLEEGAGFCPNCGAKQEESVSEDAKNNSNNSGGRTATVCKTRKPINKKLVIGLAAVLVVVIAIVLIVVNQKKKVNINDYISVEFTGYDTVGKASVDFDYEGFESAILKAQGKKVKDIEDIEDMSSDDLANLLGLANYELVDSIETDLDKSSDLSNGDEVTVTISFDKELAKKSKVKLLAKDMTVKVEGLDELQKANPFENVEITYEGLAPRLSINYKNKSDISALSDLNFYIEDKKDRYDIGDTFTLCISDEEVENAKVRGYILTETSKEYTIDSADRSVTKLADISDKALKDIQKQAFDVIEAHFGAHDFQNVESLNYEGMYILSPKDDYYENSSTIIVVCSGNVSSTDNSFITSKVYMPIKFTGVIVKADGSAYFNCVNEIIGFSALETEKDQGFNTVDGYNDPVKMYNDIITSFKDKYSYEVSDGLKVFGE